jgi:Ca2+-binding RTX toxin-like protein
MTSENQRLIGGAGDDALMGGTDNDTLHGGAGADTLIGGAGTDYLQGNEGDDVLEGGDDDDWLNASHGNDTLHGGVGWDIAFYEDMGLPTGVVINNTAAAISGAAPFTVDKGAAGVDVLISVESFHGTEMADVIHHGDGGYVFDRAGDDIVHLSGLAFFAAGSGNDAYVHTGGGRISYAVDDYDGAGAPTQGVVVRMTGADLGEATDPWGDHDVFTGVSRIVGTRLADTMTGSVGWLSFSGGDGDDSLAAGSGGAWLQGDDGDDTLTGGSGPDTLIGGAGADALDGGAGFDRLDYSTDHDAGGTAGVVVDLAAGMATDGFGDSDSIAGFEVVVGTRHADSLRGGAFDDTAYRVLVGLAGADILTGADGVEYIADYRFDAQHGGTAPITVDIPAGTVTDGFGDTDTVTLIETFEGTAFGDLFIGGDGKHSFYGHEGDDTIRGGAGEEYLKGGPGDDDIDGGAGKDQVSYHLSGMTEGVVVDLAAGTASDGFGGTDRLANIERVRGSAFADTILGDDGRNTFRGMGGADVLDGRAGVDLVMYDRDTLGGGNAGVTVNLAAGFAIDGWGLRDTLIGIENAEGGDGADRLIGDAGPNWLAGRAGDDIIQGGAGNDTLDSGEGRDMLLPGAGADQLMPGTGADTVVGTYADLLDDHLGDFGHEDRLVLLGEDGVPLPVRVRAAGGVLTVDSGGIHPVLSLPIHGTASFDLDPPLPQPVIGVEGAGFVGRTVSEGNADTASVAFVLTRSGDLAEAVTIAWRVVGVGSQPADADDFAGGTLPAGHLVIPAGTRSATVTVDIAGDTAVEPAETFAFRLDGGLTDSGLPARIAGRETLGRILNDDESLQLSIAAIEPRVGEGDGPVRFVVSRPEGTSDTPLTVAYRLAGNGAAGVDAADIAADFDGIATLTLRAGESQATISLDIVDDTLAERDESVTVRLLYHEGPDGVRHDARNRPPATATIVDDDGAVEPPAPPEGKAANAFGDPHLMTLDGLGYSFQAVGEFVLLHAPAEGDVVPAIDVQIRTAPQPGSDVVSVITAVAMTVGSARLMIGADGSAMVDGTAVLLGSRHTATAVGDGQLFTGQGRFTVVQASGEQIVVDTFDGFLNVSTYLLADRRIEGLLGNGDGDPSNDLAIRGGRTLPTQPDFADLYGPFADSWRVGTTDTLFSYAEGAGTNTFTDRSFPRATLSLDDLPSALRDDAVAKAREAGVADDRLLAYAALDIVLTGDNRFAEGAARAVPPDTAVVAMNAPAPAPTFGVTAQDPEMMEGEEAAFTVYRLGPDTDTVDIAWTLGGSADGLDLRPGTPRQGTLTFAAGERAHMVRVPVVADDRVEDDETLVLGIAVGADAPAGVMLASSEASVTILFDEIVMPVETLTLTGRGARHRGTGSGASEITAGDGNDAVAGGSGPDTLRGGNGHDLLMGGDGDDWLESGGEGANLRGGNGRDVFAFLGSTGPGTGSGVDFVEDFTPGDDLVLLDDFPGLTSFADIPIEELSAGATLLRLAADRLVVLIDIEPEQLSPADIVFV